MYYIFAKITLLFLNSKYFVIFFYFFCCASGVFWAWVAVFFNSTNIFANIVLTRRL